MAYRVFLPENKTQREIVLNRMIEKGKITRHIPEVQWWICHYYLQGVRDFKAINYRTGTVEVGFEDSSGTLQFRYDDIVSKFQAQIGRLLQINLSPKVEKKGIGLDGMRKASIAQVVLDEIFPPAIVGKLKTQIFSPLTKYGLVGAVIWNEGEDIGIDITMPWELLPIPPDPLEQKDLRGIVRTRMVPLDWVKQLSVAPGAKDKRWGEMKTTRMPVGSIPMQAGERFSTFVSTVDTTELSSGAVKSVPGATGSKAEDKTHVDVVELCEVWMKNSAGYLADYDMIAGGKLIHTKGYDALGVKMHMPISIANDIDTGGFWGRSFTSINLPMNMELEYTIGKLFQNLQDMDAYGMLVEPTTLGIPSEVMRSSDGIKRIRYEPDYSVPELKPFVISPANTNKFPVDMIKMGVALSNQIANQPTEMMKGKAPGRVDSQTSLGFLYEVSNTPITPTAEAVARAVSDCYRVALQIAQIQWPSERTVQVTLLDDSLAGISLDANSGAMSLTDNSIPHPDEVQISVAAFLPKSPEQEKMELKEGLKLGTIDMFEYRTMVRKKGLDLPVGNESEWQNYRRAMLENLILFGDGKAPGQVTVHQFDTHMVHLRVLQPFMARPEFYQASKEVRNKFMEHYNAHLQGMGGEIPDQSPYPEDAAAETQAMMQMQNQGGMPPVGGGAPQ